MNVSKVGKTYKICRYTIPQSHTDQHPRVGVMDDTEKKVIDLTKLGVKSLRQVLESKNPVRAVSRLLKSATPIETYIPSDVKLLSPVKRQEVWAAGVTYENSKLARELESGQSGLYAKVYGAERPEIFFKSQPHKVVGPNDDVGIRTDSTWNVPEPELALVISSKGKIVGYTIGNDMSSRSIEGDNALYLPQAKIYKGSCALGPWVIIGAAEEVAREWDIKMGIVRDTNTVFEGATSARNIRRSFSELVDCLYKAQEFPYGAVLLTGTGIVPPNDFTLQEGDKVKINISGIGDLENKVVKV